MSIDTINKKPKEEKLSWMDLSKTLTKSNTEDYIKVVPYQIKKIAVKDACTSFITNCKKVKKKGGKFSLRFKSKKQTRQTCYIPKQSVTEKGIYHTISGKLKYAEKFDFTQNFGDCRLTLDNGQWFINIPVVETIRCHSVEKQNRMVAIDPGIRSFCTIFSTNGVFGQIGKHDFGRLQRLCTYLDRLISKRDKLKKDMLLLYDTYNRAIKRMRWKIRNLVDELHNKVISFLVSNFDIIVYPNFDTSDMVVKCSRKLHSKSVRMMLGYKFYQFSEKLKVKCEEKGKQLVRISEAYTSKTNSFSGELIPHLGSKEYFSFDGIKVNRDINGARNILLRTLRDSSAHH